MKKYYVMVLCLVGNGLIASEPQKKEQPPCVMVNGLRQSSDAIAIPAVKKELDRRFVENSPSSGSNSWSGSPDFPGQTGLGSYYSPSSHRRDLMPICHRDGNWWYQ